MAELWREPDLDTSTTTGEWVAAGGLQRADGCRPGFNVLCLGQPLLCVHRCFRRPHRPHGVLLGHLCAPILPGPRLLPCLRHQVCGLLRLELVLNKGGAWGDSLLQEDDLMNLLQFFGGSGVFLFHFDNNDPLSDR